MYRCLQKCQDSRWAWKVDVVSYKAAVVGLLLQVSCNVVSPDCPYCRLSLCQSTSAIVYLNTQRRHKTCTSTIMIELSGCASVRAFLCHQMCTGMRSS
jgi:hypothetical protein